MIIKKLLREALLKQFLLAEGKDHKHSYGCVMVFLDIPKKEWTNFQDNIDKEDLYHKEKDDSYGLESEPHCTALYGLHSDIPDEDIEKLIKSFKRPKINFKAVSTFDNKDFDVLKFDVDSKDLHKFNKELSELPHTTDYPDYHPHVTISYVKKGTGKKYIKILNDYIKENGDLTISLDKFVYSKTDGDKIDYSID